MSSELLATPLPDQLTGAIEDVFQTMIPLPLERGKRVEKILLCQDTESLAVLGYNGTKIGSFMLSTTKLCAQKMAMALLMLDDMSELSPEDTADAFGEVLNMVGGNFKNYLVEHGQQMALSTPTVIGGASITAAVPKQKLVGFTLEFSVDSEPVSLIFYYLL